MTNVPQCLFLALVMATPAMALAGPAEGEPAAIDPRSPAEPLESLLVVRVEMEGGEAVAELLRGEVLAELRKAGVTPELPEGAPLELVVSIDDEANGAYEVVYLHRDLRLDSWTCACSGEELRARLQGAAPTMWQAAIEAAAPTPEPTPATAPAASAVDPRPTRNRWERDLWITGVTQTAIGTGLAASMSALLIVRATNDEELTGAPVALLAAGSTMVVMGGLFWGLANRSMRKRTQMGLGVGKGVAVTLQGRF